MTLRLLSKTTYYAAGCAALMNLLSAGAHADQIGPVRFAAQPAVVQPAPVQTMPAEPLLPGQPAPVVDGVQLPLPRLEIDVRPTEGVLPRNVGLDYARSLGELQGDVGPRWYLSPYSWEAAGLFHRPLYFEDAALERQGRSRFAPLQPGISAFRAAGQLVLLPAHMIYRRPMDCIYSYGYGDPRVPPVYPYPWCSPLYHNPYTNYPMHPVEPAAPANEDFVP